MQSWFRHFCLQMMNCNWLVNRPEKPKWKNQNAILRLLIRVIYRWVEKRHRCEGKWKFDYSDAMGIIFLSMYRMEMLVQNQMLLLKCFKISQNESICQDKIALTVLLNLVFLMLFWHICRCKPTVFGWRQVFHARHHQPLHYNHFPFSLDTIYARFTCYINLHTSKNWRLEPRAPVHITISSDP